MKSVISETYRGPLRAAVVATFIVGVLSALVLDFGQTARLTGVALAIFWGWTFLTLWRRPQTPTRIDLLLIRWGCAPFVVGFDSLQFYVWHLRGLY
jgi:hypothetical protein